MDEGYSATGGGPHLTVPPERALAPVPPTREVLHRRRRAGALLVLATFALLVGALVGAASRSASAGAQVTAASPHAYFAEIRRLAGKGPGSLAATEAGAETAAINRTLAYTPYVRIAGSQHREVALTFDDGPGPYTAAIVRQLERLHVPATFFEVGIEERYFHAATAAIAARGYPIGDHTESHAPMSQLSRRAQQSQLLQQVDATGAYGAPFPRLFRPPYGLWDAATLSLLKKHRMLMVLWSTDTSDYLQPGVGVIVQRALAGARPGAIILLHDAGGNRSETVAALPRIVRGLRARGYRLVTIPRLLLDNPAPHEQDVAALRGSGG
jgi:peptidoglycan-N-acetylglucosamine deacetylase